MGKAKVTSKKLSCDVCGRETKDFFLMFQAYSGEEQRYMQDTYGKDCVKICYRCALKSFGIKGRRRKIF